MNKTERPLSPHLTVYRWPITMTLSILHRMTGVAMSVGLIVLVIWLQSAATGAGAYKLVTGLLATPVAKLLLLAWTAAFFFHLANGIRHLFWDVGLGFELRTAKASAWFVVIATIVMTAGYWLVA